MEKQNEELTYYVRQLMSGDRQAFEKIYNLTGQLGYFTALKITNDPNEAQDILQDSFLAVLEKIHSLRNPEKFESWFNRIVANKARNVLVKKKPTLFYDLGYDESLEEYLWETEENFYPEQSLDRADVRQKIMEIIDNMSDEKRLCVILYYYNDMGIADIAEIAGVSENAIKARLFQARKDIRSGLNLDSKK